MALLPFHKKQLALLIDPDKVNNMQLTSICRQLKKTPFDLILVGGSLVMGDLDSVIAYLKKHTSLPVYLFPGNAMQLSDKADGILFLSLLSGRNPEYLIGQQVIAAPILKRMQLDVVSVAYMLIESGKTTSVEYMSNTKPIPSDKIDIIVATALAAEYLGFKMIYLEAGSGALKPVSQEIIKSIAEQVHIPIIVGGGIHNVHIAQNCYNAGASMVVIGSAIEQDVRKINEFNSLQK
ncbi:MAG: geranylgeranylglyceryl/heptaprenylglyceryl phosphate synthase [Bacteroidales bacterium]|nr:geranylgeranylglyceryl/heptaprenylglyceryl phosphate synthase [Bacteroidales bacterium]